MIGYYVHHHGRGHLSRAAAIIAALGTEVTVLSSLPRPTDWSGPWVSLALDDAAVPVDPDAHGRLHWVPLRSTGLRDRMAAISEWIARARPEVFVVDVSVEVTMLARLHGVPVVAVAVPGRRDDRPHTLAFDVCSAIIGAWPREAIGMVEGLSRSARRRLHAVGAIARRAPAGAEGGPPSLGEKPRVLVLSGTGGDNYSSELAMTGHSRAPGWDWSHLGGSSGRWSDDPWSAIWAADVVVTHAGEGILAEVAAARRAAIIIPQHRPHDEQLTTARVLKHPQWPAIVLDGPEDHDWTRLLLEASHLDREAWTLWNDGHGAERAATVIERVAAGREPLS